MKTAKGAAICVRLTNSEKDMLETVADSRGLTVSELVRQMIGSRMPEYYQAVHELQAQINSLEALFYQMKTEADNRKTDNA